MVATFLQQEIASARFGAAVRALLADAALPETVVTRPDLRSRAENGRRRRLLAQHRGYGKGVDGYLAGFPTRGVRWGWWSLSAQELLRVRYIRWGYWLELSGGTRLPMDAAARVRAGVEPFGVSNERFVTAAAQIRQGATLPPLILVRPTHERHPAGLVVLEGHLRLTAYALAADAMPAELEVLIGSSPAVAKWWGY